MLGNERPGTVYWVDHYVVCTNDVPRWQKFHTHVLGAVMVPEPEERRLRRGIFQTVGRCRHGGFISRAPLPTTRGLGKGLPRYGYYVSRNDIDDHLRRLDEAGATHSGPMRTGDEGKDGVSVFWQDPDGNQFEFWAPDVLPEGAMAGCGPERVGHISHGVFETRDLDRTAAFFDRYCALKPMRNADIAADTLVLPLAAGGRMIFKKVNQLEGRTSGAGLPDVHTALVVRKDDFLPAYKRLWADLPEWDHNVREDKPVENQGDLPARTVMHISPGGQKFKQATQRGDDWFDPDSNMFHFYGGTPVGKSLAVYDGHDAEDFIEEWKKNGQSG